MMIAKIESREVGGEMTFYPTKDDVVAQTFAKIASTLPYEVEWPVALTLPIDTIRHMIDLGIEFEVEALT